jgi:hypothetical protein
LPHSDFDVDLHHGKEGRPCSRQQRREAEARAELVSVNFTKEAGEGIIAADDPAEAAAVREVDLKKRFHLSATQLAKRL